jgi:hypothetical protein
VSTSNGTRERLLDVLAARVGGSSLVSGYSTNPHFKAHHPRAHEVYLEEVLDEKITARMISKDSRPLTFIVPEGCDSVQILYGAIEVNPGFGRDHDRDQVVVVGDPVVEAVVVGMDGNLVPGAPILVTVPWRAASWVELHADRLRLEVVARFFSAADQQSNS